MFFNEISIRGSWQAFERLVCRYLLHTGFSGIRLVGQTRDQGADILAHRGGKRWLIQIKHWKAKVGAEVLDKTLNSLRIYRSQVPVIVALNGFSETALRQQQKLMAQKIPLQLWSAAKLIGLAKQFPDTYPLGSPEDIYEKRHYQEEAIRRLVFEFNKRDVRSGLIVMATGLGKTHVVYEFIRRISYGRPIRVITLAHTNALVYQLERASWLYLKASEETLAWNSYERQTYKDLKRVNHVFACLNTVANYVKNGSELPDYDILFVDECHHVGDKGMYASVLKGLMAGKHAGSFLIGATATPWRPDESSLREVFGDPLVCVDLVTGLRKGFLANVDYRMYTDNIDWKTLAHLKGKTFTPKNINRRIFISNWDDAVVFELRKVWSYQPDPKAIVFCGTIDHAITMRDRINSLGFCRAEAIYSQTKAGTTMHAFERNRILCDFHDGAIQAICAVDIFNEGVDVPDVNIVVFQRVTHSRRIFIQQLGRGLRIREGKDKVLVLDFVSDIRRFAAGIDLKDSLAEAKSPGHPVRIRLSNAVTFRRVGGEDPETESFLRQWLEDVAAIESADEDTTILKFPPPLPGSRQ